MRAKFVPFVAVALFTSSLALADRVDFENGDVLTGKIVDYDGKKLSLKTEAAGTIQIDLKDVKTFSSDDPVELDLKDGLTLKQKLVPATQGSVGIAPVNGAPQTFTFDQIRVMNPPPIKWTGSVTAGAVLTRGNTFTDQYHAGFDLARRGESVRVTASGSYNFGREEDQETGDKVTSVDNWMTQGKVDYFFHASKWYTFANALAQKDRIQDLNLRFIPGAGVGYQWVETPAMNFNTEAGISWIYEDYSSQSTKEEVAARLAYHFDKTLSAKVKLIHNFEYIPGLLNGSGYLINTDLGLRADLTSTIFFEAKAVLTWNSQPAPDKSKDDLQYIFNVGWKF